ncbi:hypothetical protein MY11210_001208 [Beauveria gryllotalpidicola]
MSGFGFNYSQGFTGNQQQPNQPIRQATRVTPRYFENHNNPNSGAAFHGQSMGNWPMDQVQPTISPTPGMQNSSFQHQNPQNPSLWSPGMYSPGMQTPYMQAIQQQSCNLGQRSPFQGKQGGRNSGPEKRPPPRPPSVIDPLIKELQEMGKQVEGNLQALLNLSHYFIALRNEKDEWNNAEKMKMLKKRDEAARESRRQSRETGDHLDSSPAPKRKRAAADETPSETSSEESGHGFTYSPAAAALSRPEPIQQQSLTNGMFPPGAFINPAAATFTTLTTPPPETIQKQSYMNRGKFPPRAMLINPSDAAITATPPPEHTQKQSYMNRGMLPPGAIFNNPSAAAAAAAAAAARAPAAASPLAQQQSQQSAFTAEIPIHVTGPDGSAAETAQPEMASAAPIMQQLSPEPQEKTNPNDLVQDDNAAENAADFIRLTPLLEVINGPEDTDELPKLPEATGAAEEEHPPPMGPNDDLFGEEHPSPMGPNDELFDTEGHHFEEELAAMVQETDEGLEADEAYEFWV